MPLHPVAGIAAYLHVWSVGARKEAYPNIVLEITRLSSTRPRLEVYAPYAIKYSRGSSPYLG